MMMNNFTIAIAIIFAIYILGFLITKAYWRGYKAHDLESVILNAIKTEKQTALEILDLFEKYEIKSFSLGEIYVALNRLEKQGWIEEEFEPGSPPRRKRYYFSPNAKKILSQD